jgi:EAL domain-containing protein (putative c-di-GMP-specific phosphodiesterase class I)
MTKNSASSPEPTTRDVVANDLGGALERHEFFLVYQPEIDLRTNAFAGVEALIRWRHPRAGVINPVNFVSELESTGLIVSVGQWAMETACLQGAQWHSRGYRFPVSVNISDRQFVRAKFLNDVDEVLRTSRFVSTLLVLEFAQRTLLDQPDARKRLAALRELGVRIAIDDFIPGERQLADVRTLPIDIVKLDRQFVASLHDDPDAVAQVHELVGIAKIENVQIVASGIEDAEQRRWLQLEDVTIGQGYLFSKPHEADEIDQFLEDFSIFSGKPL